MKDVVDLGMKVPPRSLHRHPERRRVAPKSKDPVEFHGDAASNPDRRPNTGDYWIYILTNERRTVLYIGITNDLEGRVAQHSEGRGSGFTKRYHLSRLVYYESFPDPVQAIGREKQLKGWSRTKKVALISKMNPEFVDLARTFRGTLDPADSSHHEVPRGPSTPLRSAQDDTLVESPSNPRHPERSAAGAQSKDPVELHGDAALNLPPSGWEVSRNGNA